MAAMPVTATSSGSSLRSTRDCTVIGRRSAAAPRIKPMFVMFDP